MTQSIQVSQSSPSSSPIEPPLKERILAEALQQTRECAQIAYCSSQLTLLMLVANGVVGLVGVGLLLTGYASEGTVTAASGAISGISVLHLYREASEQRQEANEHLENLIVSLQQVH